MWNRLTRFGKRVLGIQSMDSKVQDLVITTRRKDFVFDELEGLPDTFQYILVFDKEFYSLYSDWKPERSESEKS